jgi:hypothetical protein
MRHPFTLEDHLVKWASSAGVASKATEWKEQLLQHGIGNITTLEECATDINEWNALLKNIEGSLLAVKLRLWYKEKYYPSMTLKIQVN